MLLYVVWWTLQQQILIHNKLISRPVQYSESQRTHFEACIPLEYLFPFFYKKKQFCHMYEYIKNRWSLCYDVWMVFVSYWWRLNIVISELKCFQPSLVLGIHTGLGGGCLSLAVNALRKRVYALSPSCYTYIFYILGLEDSSIIYKQLQCFFFLRRKGNNTHVGQIEGGWSSSFLTMTKPLIYWKHIDFIKVSNNSNECTLCSSL